MKKIILIITFLALSSCTSTNTTKSSEDINPLESPSDIKDLLGFSEDGDEPKVIESIVASSEPETEEESQSDDPFEEDKDSASLAGLLGVDEATIEESVAPQNETREIASSDSESSQDDVFAELENSLEEETSPQEEIAKNDIDLESFQGEDISELLGAEVPAEKTSKDTSLAALLGVDAKTPSNEVIENKEVSAPIQEIAILDLTTGESPELSSDLYFEDGKLMVKKKTDNLNLTNNDLNELLGVKEQEQLAPKVNKIARSAVKNYKKPENVIMPQSFAKVDQEAITIKKLLKERKERKNKKRIDRNVAAISRIPASFNKLVGLKENTTLTEKKYNPKSLFFASKNAVGETLRYLIEKKNIDVNSINNNDGKTALHYAIEKKKYGNIRALLKLGADLSIKDSTGNTPKDLAMKNGVKLPKIVTQ